MPIQIKHGGAIVDVGASIKHGGAITPVDVYVKVAGAYVAAGIDAGRYMIASHTVAPNYRINTSTPEVLPSQKYHLSGITFDRAPWSANSYRFCWQNSYTTTFGSTPAELLPGNSITIRAAVYDSNNNLLHAVTFGGESEVTLGDGELVWCDPIPASAVEAGDLVMRTYSAIPDAGVRVGRRPRDNTATRIHGTSDQAAALAMLTTPSGAFIPNTGTTSPNNYAFGPVCQVADHWDGRSCVLVVGDSIAAANDNGEGRSWITNALYSESSGRMGYYNMAIHGTRASNQTGDAAYGYKAAIIESIKTINGGALPMTHIVSEMGVNDAGGTDVAALQAKVHAWLEYLNGKWPVPLVQTTYTPRNVNDAANIQTAEAGMIASTQSPANADRWGVADWIKTNPAPLAGHIDVREAWTGSPGGTIWRLIAWQATLTAPAAIGASSIQVDTAPPAGIVPVLTPGSSSTVECTGIPITGVTGSGPYTVTLGKSLTKAHSAGAVVKSTMSADGLHPEEGHASSLAQAIVEAAKGVIL